MGHTEIKLLKTNERCLEVPRGNKRHNKYTGEKVRVAADFLSEIMQEAVLVG